MEPALTFDQIVLGGVGQQIGNSQSSRIVDFNIPNFELDSSYNRKYDLVEMFSQ